MSGQFCTVICFFLWLTFSAVECMLRFIIANATLTFVGLVPVIPHTVCFQNETK